MAIRITTDGFSRASLETGNGAYLHARFQANDPAYDPLCFKVKTEDPEAEDDHGWCFNEEGCREAAEFFTQLATELKRRRLAAAATGVR